jgi:glycosyltransferase involved in cell wall biosynthesis
MATIGLSMIVKNEEKLILRCLESVRPLVDFVCICDTGSTDATINIIRNFLKEHNLPGQIVEDPWIDFAANRNRALLALNQHKIDYAFVIDADDQLVATDSFDYVKFKDSMEKDVYDLCVVHGGVVHGRPQIFRNKPGYSWRGVLHEFIDAPPGFSRETVDGFGIRASVEGSRNADPMKFQKDVEILENALKTEKDAFLRTRYTFYLAQSYRDSSQPEKALKAYLDRANMGGWDGEIYVSLFESIRACTRLGSDVFDRAKDCCERAESLNTGRCEALHAMSFLCRQLGKNKEGMEVARRGLDRPMPNGGLFLEPWIYQFGLKDEFAINAYWAGHYLESLEANIALLASAATPPNMVKRLADNANVSLDKLKPRLNLFYSD